ncbi:MAG: PEP-CTERM sorting domain-containing protein [Gemmatimonadota bacterium]|nr:MAG: PEP-CTERM sorting domain-containing protein [Gemmatimonadota bacterium]
MRKLVLLLVLLPLVAVWVYGCNDTTPTETETAATDVSFDFQGTRRGLSSTFDTDAEGWTLVGGANGAAYIPGSDFLAIQVFVYYDAAAGSPGGAVYADDTPGDDWFFQAPPKFLGNRLGAYGGALEFDLNAPSSVGFERPDVVLAGDGLTLVVDAGDSPAGQWTSYRVGLDELSGWKVIDLNGQDATANELRRVLKNLVLLRIRGEYFFGSDRAYLDNVRFVPPGEAK